jgi:pimeloyl-ACP methyl ester carboxylesterase
VGKWAQFLCSQRPEGLEGLVLVARERRAAGANRLRQNFAGSPQARLAWPAASAYENISPVVGNIAVPTLILAGDQDRQDPLDQQQREVLSRIPVRRSKSFAIADT